MLFKKGDRVFYRKYEGIITEVYDYNKTYGVELIHYRNFDKIVKQIDQNELYVYEQLVI